MQLLHRHLPQDAAVHARSFRINRTIDDTESTTDEDPTSALTTDFSQTVEALFAAGGTEETLSKVLGLAVDTIEGCDFADILLLGPGGVARPFYSDPVITALGVFHHRDADAPGLQAIAQNAIYYVDDLTRDMRWPDFGLEATALGIRGVLALPLTAEGRVGALSLYARYPQAFGVIDRARGVLLASMAAVAYSSALARQDADTRAANLRAALTTREVIGQAQGILMERERITAEQSFNVLRRASQHLNLKLREVAQTLVDTGEKPFLDTDQD